MKKNVASQVIGAQMISATDGSAFTGSVTCSVTGDGGTQATGSVGSGACTHEGNGFHTYAPAQAETNYDHIAFTFTGSGAIPVTLQVFTTFPQTGDSFARIGANGAGLTALPWNADWDTEVESEVTDGLNAYDPPTRTELTSDKDEILAAIAAVDALITALENLSAAEVNAEVLDVLNTDTFGAPTGVPAATATLIAKLGRLYEALVQGVDVTASKKQFKNAAGTVIWEKDLSDDGTTYSETAGNAP